MNITRENLGDLDLLIKVEIVESDYAERVSKQLKEYQKKATVPGFRKGMAPMGLIQRMYKSAVVADEVQSLLGESLYKYLDDEKLDILGSLSQTMRRPALLISRKARILFSILTLPFRPSLIWHGIRWMPSFIK